MSAHTQFFVFKEWGRRLLIGLLAGFFALSVAGFITPVSAAPGIPTIMAYQGRLADASGNLLGTASGTTYYFKFSIYNVSSTATGTRLWPASAPASTSATVTSGVFTVNIGDTTNGYPDALDFDFATSSDAFLQIEVSATADGTYETLGPRQRISASGYAINAKTVGGWNPNTSFAVGTTTLPANTLFHVATSSNIFTVASNGRVGIGTSTPSTSLHLAESSANIFGIFQSTDSGGGQITAQLQLRNGGGSNVAIGITDNTERFNVLLGGTARMTLQDTGMAIGGTGFGGNGGAQDHLSIVGAHANTTGISTGLNILSTGLNNTTGGYTGILLNAVGTYSGTGEQLLMNLQANTSTKFAVTTAGNVGIGTSAPSSTLHVVGDLRVSSSVFYVSSTSGFVGIGTSTPHGPIEIYGTNTTVYLRNASDTTWKGTIKTTSSSKMVLGSSNASYVGSQDILVLDLNGGGAQVPNSLEVHYTTGNVGNTFITADTNDFAKLIMYSNGGGAKIQLYATGTSYFNGVGGKVVVGSSTASALFTVATSTDIMQVFDTGGVVLGNASGSDRGYGTLNAVAVYDDSTLLTDYVFDKYFTGSVLPEDQEQHGDYRMLTIDEMKEFVAREKHLPSITGRDEWKQSGGISLGKLASQLWQAVEESSLYITQLHDRLRIVEGSQLQGNVSASAQLTSFTDIKLSGLPLFNGDTVGEATIKYGDNQVRVVFETPYPTRPIATITPLSFIDGAYRVTGVDTSGFTIEMFKPQAGDVSFTWHSFPAPQTLRVISSNGIGGVPQTVPEEPVAEVEASSTPAEVTVEEASSSPATEASEGGEPEPAPAEGATVEETVTDPGLPEE